MEECFKGTVQYEDLTKTKEEDASYGSQTSIIVRRGVLAYQEI